jgi:hypothetical protein
VAGGAWSRRATGSFPRAGPPPPGCCRSPPMPCASPRVLGLGCCPVRWLGGCGLPGLGCWGVPWLGGCGLLGLGCCGVPWSGGCGLPWSAGCGLPGSGCCRVPWSAGCGLLGSGCWGVPWSGGCGLPWSAGCGLLWSGGCGLLWSGGCGPLVGFGCPSPPVGTAGALRFGLSPFCPPPPGAGASDAPAPLELEGFFGLPPAGEPAVAAAASDVGVTPTATRRTSARIPRARTACPQRIRPVPNVPPFPGLMSPGRPTPMAGRQAIYDASCRVWACRTSQIAGFFGIRHWSLRRFRAPIQCMSGPRRPAIPRLATRRLAGTS